MDELGWYEMDNLGVFLHKPQQKAGTKCELFHTIYPILVPQSNIQ